GRETGITIRGSELLSRACRRHSIQRPLRTRRRRPAGRHSPTEQSVVMLGQPWALLDRRALSSSLLEKFWQRASNLIWSPSRDHGRRNASSFAPCAHGSCKRASATTSGRSSSPAPGWAKEKL